VNDINVCQKPQQLCEATSHISVQPLKQKQWKAGCVYITAETFLRHMQGLLFLQPPSTVALGTTIKQQLLLLLLHMTPTVVIRRVLCLLLCLVCSNYLAVAMAVDGVVVDQASCLRQDTMQQSIHRGDDTSWISESLTADEHYMIANWHHQHACAL